jgi:hypothetical protein
MAGRVVEFQAVAGFFFYQQKFLYAVKVLRNDGCKE